MPVKICSDCNSQYGGFVFFSNKALRCHGCAEQYREQQTSEAEHRRQMELRRMEHEAEERKLTIQQQEKEAEARKAITEQQEKTTRENHERQINKEIAEIERCSKEELAHTELLKEQERTKQKEADARRAEITAKVLDRSVEYIKLFQNVDKFTKHTLRARGVTEFGLDASLMSSLGADQNNALPHRPWTTTHAILSPHDI